MKKFLIKCFVFLGIIVVLNVLYLLILLNYSPGFKKVYEVSNFQDKDYDLIVLGNSMALDGIDAGYISKQGIKTYNLAVAGNHVSTTLMLFENYLKSNQKPKMVVVGLSSAVGKSYLNPEPYPNPEVDFFYKNSLWQNIKNPPLLNFQWLAVDMAKILISKEHRNATMVNGQWRTEKVIPDNSRFNLNREAPKYYDNNYFVDLIKLCNENNIKVFVVEMTGSKSSQNNLALKKEYFISKSKKVIIYNLNNRKIASELINPQTDWLAPNHLNVFGAKKETQFIFKKIIKPNYTQ